MTEYLNSGLVNVDINSLKIHPDNPRDGNVFLIKESIKSNGFYGALIVQKSTDYILKGNHTFQALKELGYEKVPVIRIDVGDSRARKILVADNKSSDLSKWNSQKLGKLINDLDGDLDGILIDDSAISILMDSLIDSLEVDANEISKIKNERDIRENNIDISETALAKPTAVTSSNKKIMVADFANLESDFSENIGFQSEKTTRRIFLDFYLGFGGIAEFNQLMQDNNYDIYIDDETRIIKFPRVRGGNPEEL